MKKIVLLFALSIMTMTFGYAQGPSKAEVKMKEIVAKYEKVAGVDCTVLEKGSGLGIVKMMLNQQIGKDFMKGVTSIIIIDFSEAKEQTRKELNQDIDTFKTMLQEFKSDDDKDSAGKEKTRGFAYVSDDGTISDFLFASEDSESKMLMYMAGKINVKDLVNEYNVRMATILFNIIILPIESIIELVFCSVYDSIAHFGAVSVFVSIIAVSLAVNFLALPLYNIADALQLKEREVQNKLSDRLKRIKKALKEVKKAGELPVTDGQTRKIGQTACVKWEVKEDASDNTKGMLLRKDEEITVVCNMEKELSAPVKEGTKIGEITCLVGTETVRKDDIVITDSVEKIDFEWCVWQVFQKFYVF